MAQNILFYITIAIAAFIIVGETIAEKFPTHKFSKWWRENVVSEEQSGNDGDC